MGRVLFFRCLALLGVVLSTLAVGILAAPAGDLVPRMPGQPGDVPFKQYAGYIRLKQSFSTKNMFYYFVEAETDPLTKPLILWLNGGPGCSSLGGGFAELGPFFPNESGTGLVVNNYSWNKEVNVLFLDSPVGVGFSYSTNTSDYSIGDDQTAADALAFLLDWLVEYPEYKCNDFYITGESYAGHYVPILAAAVLANNKISGQAQINLKGIFVSNPLLEVVTDRTYSVVEFTWSHGMMSEPAHDKILQLCDYVTPNRSEDCIAAENVGFREAGLFTSYLDAYDVLADVCQEQGAQATRLKGLLSSSLLSESSDDETTPPDPCIIRHLTTYLNRPDVRSALHSEVGLWEQCSSTLKYNLTNAFTPIAPILADLIDSGLRVWICSGDVDSVVSLIGTRKILTALAESKNWSITSGYQIWLEDNQIGGWTISWGPLVYSTVRGAAHMVPVSQPARALELFSAFIADDPSPPLAPA